MTSGQYHTICGMVGSEATGKFSTITHRNSISITQAYLHHQIVYIYKTDRDYRIVIFLPFQPPHI